MGRKRRPGAWIAVIAVLPLGLVAAGAPGEVAGGKGDKRAGVTGAPAVERRGTPVLGPRGRRETVTDIMDRERFRKSEPGRDDVEREEARLRPVPPRTNPDAPGVSA
ncbi:MAG TPA: hypothetical protein VFD06_09790, partial [Candidatus Polarisedimenticolia bacterium]|nr:hypothetical protein [Candidatus Polarisedimenticolia bacterium]